MSAVYFLFGRKIYVPITRKVSNVPHLSRRGVRGSFDHRIGDEVVVAGHTAYICEHVGRNKLPTILEGFELAFI